MLQTSSHRTTQYQMFSTLKCFSSYISCSYQAPNICVTFIVSPIYRSSAASNSCSTYPEELPPLERHCTVALLLSVLGTFSHTNVVPPLALTASALVVAPLRAVSPRPTSSPCSYLAPCSNSQPHSATRYLHELFASPVSSSQTTL